MSKLYLEVDHVMVKPDFCISERKGTAVCFSQLLFTVMAISCGNTSWSMSSLVGDLEDSFSRGRCVFADQCLDVAHGIEQLDVTQK